MTQDEKKRKRLIILGLGLTFTLLILGGAWLWMDRENIAWRADDAKFAKYRELYAAWDKTCPDGLALSLSPPRHLKDTSTTSAKTSFPHTIDKAT